MVERSQGHLSTYIVSHCDQRDTENGICLMQIIFLFLIDVIVAVMKHGLNLENIASTLKDEQLGTCL